MMETINLGLTGLKISRLCLGTMQFGWTADKATSFNILDAAFEAGINFIDTADIYSQWAEGKCRRCFGRNYRRVDQRTGNYP